MINYERMSYEEQRARNAYLSFDKIDIRQLLELHDLLQEMHQGLSVWEAMRQLENVMDIWAFGIFDRVLKETYDLSSHKKSEATRAKHKERIRSFINPVFLEDATDADLTERSRMISELMNYVEENSQTTSFELAAAIVRMVLYATDFFPSLAAARSTIPYHKDELLYENKVGANTNPEPWAYMLGYMTPQDHILDKLEEQEKWLRAQKTPSPIVGSLLPRSEEDFLGRLQPYISKMREDWSYEGCQKLIQGLEITASGSGQIKPHLFNPEFLPSHLREQCPERFEDFSVYMEDDPTESSYKEDLYGTRVAYITTYSIRFIPCAPDQASELLTTVRKALRILGMIPPAFAIPTDHGASPYQRPFFEAKNLDQIPSERPEIENPNPDKRDEIDWTRFAEDFRKAIESARPGDFGVKRFPQEKNCTVGIADGHVLIHTRLDLDDLYVLYYLLEHYMNLNPGIAQAMNAARFLEARSAPQEKNDADAEYNVDCISPDLKNGHLAGAKDPLSQALNAARNLYTTEKIDERALIEQVASVAALSLSGVLVDCHGIFPPFDGLRLENLSSGTKENGHSLTFQEALSTRIEQFLKVISGQAPDADIQTKHLANALYHAQVTGGDAVRQQWQATLANQWHQIREQAFEPRGSFEDFPKMMNDEDAVLRISDLLCAASRGQTGTEKNRGNDDDTLTAYAQRLKDLEKRARLDNPNVIDREVALAHLAYLKEQERQRIQEEKMLEDSRKRMIQPRVGLVVRDPDVPPCCDRVYPGTLYTSRMKGSTIPRRELPEALRAFLQPGSDPYQDMRHCIRLTAEANPSTGHDGFTPPTP